VPDNNRVYSFGYTNGSYRCLEYFLIYVWSKSGCPYDNACEESFFSAAKSECIYRKEYVTMDEVEEDLFAY